MSPTKQKLTETIKDWARRLSCVRTDCTGRTSPDVQQRLEVLSNVVVEMSDAISEMEKEDNPLVSATTDRERDLITNGLHMLESACIAEDLDNDMRRELEGTPDWSEVRAVMKRFMEGT